MGIGVGSEPLRATAEVNLSLQLSRASDPIVGRVDGKGETQSPALAPTRGSLVRDLIPSRSRTLGRS